jgi:haloalkane dehalogenase
MLRLMGTAPVTAFDRASNLLPLVSSGGFGVGKHYGRASREAFRGPFARGGGRTLSFHSLMRELLGKPSFTDATEVALSERFADRPVLTIFGERNDPFGFQERFRRYFEQPPTEHVLERGNHFPMCDDPGAFAEWVRAWESESVRAGAEMIAV